VSDWRDDTVAIEALRIGQNIAKDEQRTRERAQRDDVFKLSHNDERIWIT
jgi:hypothetical protein